MSIIKEIPQLPLRFLFKNLPAFPVEGMLDTLARLAIRYEQTMQAKQGLTETFTINGVTDVAYAFLDALSAAGNLYVINMSRFEALKPQVVGGACRFSPATVTLLSQNAETKALTPIAILVSGYLGQGLQLFTRATATLVWSRRTCRRSFSFQGGRPILAM
jgi:hypothetical protein